MEQKVCLQQINLFSYSTFSKNQIFGKLRFQHNASHNKILRCKIMLIENKMLYTEEI